MSADNATLSHHPAPYRERAKAWELAFGLLGGPAAWFGQLCAGTVLSDWPCFPKSTRMTAPVAGYEWTWAAIGIISLVAFLVALAAMLVSRGLLQRTRGEEHGGHGHLIEIGSGRTRFLALWGSIAGAAFAIVTAFTAVAFFILPRCAG